MPDTLQKEKKKVFTFNIKRNIENEEWQKLIKVLPGAEDAGVSNTLLKSASKKVGKYLYSSNRYYEAIVFSNKARAKDSKTKSTFILFVNSVQMFFNENVEEFSKSDLAEFKQTILPIIDFHKLKHPAHRKIVDSTEHMFRRIDYRIKYVAKEIDESKLTFRIQQIKDSLYGDMTSEEVQHEFARLLVPKLREKLDEEDDNEEEKKTAKKKPTSKKRKGKKKDK
jgi:hypothetical protein